MDAALFTPAHIHMHIHNLTGTIPHRQTDRQTDRWTEGRTDSYFSYDVISVEAGQQPR